MVTNKRKAVPTVLIVFTILFLSACRDMPPNTVNSPADVTDKVIGALAGTPSERLADELGSARAFLSGQEMMTHLRAGAIDCVIMENSAAVELVSKSTGVKILSASLIEYELRFAIPKENAELLEAVNSALGSLKQNGTLTGLSGKYFAGRSYTYVTPQEVESRPGSLSLAVPSDSPPFSYKDAEGELSGLDIEVAHAVCDYLGVELRIIEYDAWELVSAVRFGMVDLALGWLPSEGDELVNTSNPYAEAVHVVVVRR